jgi:lipoate synthase
MVSYRVVAAQKVEPKADVEAEEKAEVVKKKRGRKPNNATVDALPPDLNSELKEKSLDTAEPPSLFNTNAPVTKINIQQDSDE